MTHTVAEAVVRDDVPAAQVLPGEAVVRLGSGLLSYIQSWAESIDTQYAQQCACALQHLVQAEGGGLSCGQVVAAVQVGIPMCICSISSLQRIDSLWVCLSACYSIC